MVKVLSFGLILASALVAAGETNTWQPPLKLFSVPDAKLQKLPEEPPKPRPILELLPASTVNASLTASPTLSETDQYQWINGTSPLTQMSRKESAGALGWLEDNAFAIDVVQVKKVKLTGSVVTAIHRKNPFFLLHPFFFGIDW